MTYFLLRRTFGFIATLIAVSIVVFAVMNVLPGDPALTILGMDASNLRDLRRRCPASRAHVVRPALEPVGGGDVADPYYGGPQGFDVNYDQLSAACEGWLDRIAAGSVVRPPVE